MCDCPCCVVIGPTPEQQQKKILENLEDATQWVIEVCKQWGTELSTAYKVAGAFSEGIEAERRKVTT
jgi:hypothetical protein